MVYLKEINKKQSDVADPAKQNPFTYHLNETYSLNRNDYQERVWVVVSASKDHPTMVESCKRHLLKYLLYVLWRASGC